MTTPTARGQFAELLVPGYISLSEESRDSEGLRLRVTLVVYDTTIIGCYNFSITELEEFDRHLSDVRHGRQHRVELHDQDHSFTIYVADAGQHNASVLLSCDLFLPLVSVDETSKYGSTSNEGLEWIDAVVGSGVRVLFSQLDTDADQIAAFHRDLRRLVDGY